MSVQIPIVNAPHKYIQHFGLEWTNTSTVIINSELNACQCRDSNNSNDIYLNGITLAPVITNKGALGLDNGTVADSSWYAVHVIGDSTQYNQCSAIFSLSASNPVLPKGYDMFRRIGWVRTDGSANILDFWQAYPANSTGRWMWYDVPTEIISIVSAAPTAFRTQSLAAVLPEAKLYNVSLSAAYNPAGQGTDVQFRTTGSTASIGPQVLTGVAIGIVQTATLPMLTGLLAGVPSLDFRCTSASDQLTVNFLGYVDEL